MKRRKNREKQISNGNIDEHGGIFLPSAALCLWKRAEAQGGPVRRRFCTFLSLLPFSVYALTQTSAQKRRGAFGYFFGTVREAGKRESYQQYLSIERQKRIVPKKYPKV